MVGENFNYYEVLDVDPEASQEKIYDAYQSAKQTYDLSNPEIYKVFSESEALDWINVIEEAYSVIGHPNTRRVYDQERTSTDHASLPSFDLDASTEPKKTSVAHKSKQTLPEGFATTKFSQYKVNKQMESLIKNQEICDGLFLKKVRQYKNIDLTEFSQVTCIAIRHLYAIENNNFSVLPAPVFVRGYIVQYCRVLGLDESRVVPSFMTLLKND